MNSLVASKDFITYLKNKKVNVTAKGLVHLKDLSKVTKLFQDFEQKINQKKTLPDCLKNIKNKVIKIEIDDIPRNNQDMDKFKVKILQSWKNHDQGTWGGMFEGTVKELYKFYIKECYQDAKIASEMILDAMEDEDNWDDNQ